MIEFEGKKFLNEQEAYLYCLEQIKIIKQSLGNALPDPIQGPQGDTGADGARGPVGPRGNGIFGCTAVLPSATAYQEGDMYLLFNGQLYKKINGSWVMQTTLKGPQGPVGLTGGTEVIANPADAAALLLVCYHAVNNLGTFFHVKGEVFGALKRCVEIDRDLLNRGVVLGVFNGIVHCGVIEGVNHHVDTQVRMLAFGNVLLQLGKGTLTAHLLVVATYTIKTHPDRISSVALKGELRIGSDGA